MGMAGTRWAPKRPLEGTTLYTRQRRWTEGHAMARRQQLMLLSLTTNVSLEKHVGSLRSRLEKECRDRKILSLKTVLEGLLFTSVAL
ncbi:putative bile acyl-CoA synthetase [Sesbania bispinosa]|nr:putative bile acyl-CoA synthetase [Sesbania bispinosa]